jgi:hypothetical protein
MDYAPFWSFWKRCSGKSCWMRRGRCNWRFSSLASHATHKRSWKTKQTKKILKNVNVKKEGWGCVIVSHPRVILMNSPRRVWRTHLITDRHRYTPQFECLSTCHTYSRSFGKDSKSDADNAERDTAPYYTRPSPVHPLYCPSPLKTFGLYWRIYVRIWVEWPTLTLCDVWLLLRRSSTSSLPVWH